VKSISPRRQFLLSDPLPVADGNLCYAPFLCELRSDLDLDVEAGSVEVEVSCRFDFYKYMPVRTSESFVPIKKLKTLVIIRFPIRWLIWKLSFDPILAPRTSE